MITEWQQLKLIYPIFFGVRTFLNYLHFFDENKNVIKNTSSNKNMKLVFKQSYTYAWSALAGRAATENRLEPECSRKEN